MTDKLTRGVFDVPRSFSVKPCILFLMIEFKLKSSRILIDFSFFAVIALFLLTNSGFGMAALCACGLHELSHLIMMIIFRVSADEILFYGAGICISSREISRADKLPRILILTAGCAGNIFAAAFLFLMGHNVAAVINLLTAFFNILPIGSFDGAQLLKYFAISRCKPENVDKIVRFAEIISAVMLSVIVILFGGISISLTVIILYIVFISSIKS